MYQGLLYGITPGRYISRASYNPIEDFPGLFQSFAAISPTEEGILRFAHTYGRLGLSTPIWFSDELQQRTKYPYGELVADWQTEIEAMRQAIVLWDALQAGNAQWFSDIQVIRIDPWDAIQWPSPDANGDRDRLQLAVQGMLPIHGNHSVSYAIGRTVLHGTYTFPRWAWNPEELQQQFSLNDVISIGWRLLNAMINHRLEQHTGTHMRYMPDEARLRIEFIPQNLLGALWLQLARGIDGQKTYLRCRGCNNWIEVSLKATGYRTSRAYCSDACRSKAYRERQLRAYQFAAQGMAIAAIADNLGTTPEKVQGWLAKTPPAGAFDATPRRRGRPRKRLPSGVIS